jgi:hypothetical protein
VLKILGATSLYDAAVPEANVHHARSEIDGIDDAGPPLEGDPLTWLEACHFLTCSRRG